MPSVLLVEDEAILSEPFKLVLRLALYDVDVARNGEEALTLVARNRYDLILLDLMMPVLDGVGFLRRVPKERLADTKVVILSNLSSGTEVEAALALGAQQHVLKAALTPRDIVQLAKTSLAPA